MLAAETVNGTLGHSILLIGLVCATFGALATVYGIRTGDGRLLRSTQRYAVGVAVAGIGAFAAMERALIDRDFSLAYVQQVGSASTPFLYNITAIWSALEGSILLWLVILVGYTVVIARRFRKRLDDPLVAWALVVMFVVCIFFFVLTLGPADAFRAGAVGVTSGPGPNPLLQNNVLVLFHPPILYLGYVGMTVPFAFAIAALITGRVGERWLTETRRFALFAWGFLTIGILLGGWWSYEVLGWSGVWGWDPVENASLLPWLTGTAYIHSVLVQERRGMLRVWNLTLLVSTFALTILGTFLTRSGVIKSVHAFSNGTIGPYLLSFFGLVTIVSLALIAWRGDRLRSPGAIDSPMSREGAFLANNVLFTVFAFVVLLGTVFPLIVEAVQNRSIKVGSPYFEALSVPFGLILLFLMAVAPVLPWRKASTELLRDRLFWPAWGGVIALVVPLIYGADGFAALLAFGLGGFAAGAALRQLILATRRQGLRGLVGRANGGMVVHIGVIIVAVALVASTTYTHSSTRELTVGTPVSYGGHTFELVSVDGFTTSRSNGVRAAVSIDGGKSYAPAISTYTNFGTNIPTPSVKNGILNDIYLTLDAGSKPGDKSASIKIFIKPLVVWLWIGGALMVFGTALAGFPGKRRRRPTDPTSAPIELDGAPPAPKAPVQEPVEAAAPGAGTGASSEEPVSV
ncbi:MAG: ccmF [Ilumatobacteraceae bacterium]|nr:ccmF [Ilumatobacteraceae bacterium]